MVLAQQVLKEKGTSTPNLGWITGVTVTFWTMKQGQIDVGPWFWLPGYDSVVIHMCNHHLLDRRR